MLSPQLLELLREWWRAARPQAWLLPRPEPGQPDVRPAAWARRARRREPGGYRQASVAAHLARHSFATHLLEPRTSTSALSRFCSGTPSFETTALYTRVAVNTIRDVTSPLDRLGVNLARATAARLTVARPPGHSPGVADIFRTHGSAWCRANAGHVSLGQLKVMSAIEHLPHCGAWRSRRALQRLRPC